jgi:D-3-phosphoglycerate dehydrogenase
MAPPLRVLVADSLASDQLEPLRRRGIEVLDRAGLSAEELAKEIGSCHGVLVRSRTRITEELLAQAPNLRVVGRAGTGTDNVDLDAATRAGVVVMNVPGGNSVAAAEHTIALLCAMARHVPEAAASVRAGRWERGAFQGIELTGKTLGIIGLGRIGREVASRAQGLRMRVLAHDPITNPDVAADLGLELRSLRELFSECDAITVHVPLGPGTRHLIGDELLSGCRPGLRLLNVARGGIVDEAALLRALESGRVAGAALDVFETEPPTNEALVNHPSVVATPHLGASTAEAQVNVAVAIAEQVAAFLCDGVVTHAVNLVGLDPELRERLGPWFRLARCLGGLAASLVDTGIAEVDVTVMGELAGQPKEPLVTEVLLGLMKPFGMDRVNAVNARLFAEERGIRWTVGHRISHRSFSSLLQISVKGASEPLTVAGTLFGTRNLRIVRAFGFNMDAVPEGPMLWCVNDDRPGVIGHLGTVLADAGINIANMSVGRDPERGQALAVLNLDEDPPAEVMARLAGHAAIRWVKLVPASSLR